MATVQDRRWLGGGALGAVALLATGWFALVSPQHSQAGGLREQADSAQLTLVSLRHKLNELRSESADLAEYRAELDSLRQALPTTAALPAFVRELRAAEARTGVHVTSMHVGVAAELTGAGAYSLPITVTVVGTPAAFRVFLDELQLVQPRALLISNVMQGGGTLTVTMRAFVAPKQTGAGSAAQN